MYRVGFGDCFLVTIAGKHILIDCGVHTQSEFKGIAEAVQAIKTATDGKLAVVVATHAHADHISGFGTEAETFQELEVGEVWMPWLEDLSDDVAKTLHTKTAALAGLLHAHLNVAGAAADPLVEGIALNALGAVGRSSTGNNAKALELLRGGFGDKQRTKYLRAGEVLQDAGGIKGLTVRVLAPSDDTKFLSRMNPPEAQLYGLDENGQPTIEELVPFAERWKADGGPLDADYQKLLNDTVAMPLQALALSVDNYLNNTSLCLLMTYKGKKLLFPGDAQWGNWQSWQNEWDDILGEIDFYKVGHHGSHNATPHEALAKMTGKSVVAMASTDTVKSFNKGKFPVPYDKLVTAVKEQVGNRYAQSDQLSNAGAPFEAEQGWCDYFV
ncbi:MAG TPA: MBL fold metallo-hydrolase [Thermoanaerobaculia bacterium]|nr:MBL fold metallo-hydrolase [Thermoanaerobaculia bacterium]